MMPIKKSILSTPENPSAHKSAKLAYIDTPSPDGSQGSQGSPFVLMGESMSTAPREKYVDRKGHGDSLATMNPMLEKRKAFEPSDKKPLGMRCRLETNKNDMPNVSERYRYMFTTLDERCRAFENHLIRMQEAMCELAGVSPEDLTPVGLPSQDVVWVCGKVVCESSEGKMNRTSVLLEGSRRDSSGRRIQLDLQELSTYSLFPGQIVLVEGINSNGRVMVAKRSFFAC